jgi:hypothetical protein
MHAMRRAKQIKVNDNFMAPIFAEKSQAVLARHATDATVTRPGVGLSVAVPL